MRKGFLAAAFPNRPFLRRIVPCCFFPLLCACLFFRLAPATASAAQNTHPTVLLLHSYRPGLVWTDNIMAGIRDGFGAKIEQLHLQVEYLDSLRYDDYEYFHGILDAVIHHKFEGRHFDLVLLSDNLALEFVLKYRNDLFRQSAIVFCGINNFRPALIAGVEDITGVAEYPSFRETLETALNLHPGTREVVVIGGRSTRTNQENRNMLVAALEDHPFPPALRFVFWDDVPAEELPSRLQRLPAASLVLVNGSIARRSGETIPYLEEMQLIAAATQRPIYSLWAFFLGEGIVGGKLVSGWQHGRMAAEMALRILAGEDPESIPVAVAPNRYMFDYAQLKRFGLDLRQLPEDSVIINRPPSLYALSRGQLWAALAILSALSALLLANFLIRRRVQKKLQEEKERVDLLLGSAAEAIYGIDLQGICTFCNPAALRMLGLREEKELLGKNVHERIHHTRADGTPYPAGECRVCLAYRRQENLHVEDEVFWRADGSSFPVEYWSHPIRKDQRTVGAVVTFLDIGERKKAEETRAEALRELNAFVYTVSHDLRTPLSVIVGFTDYLRQNYEPQLDANGRTALQAMAAESGRMEAILSDLLSLSQVGQLPPPAEPVDLEAIVRKVGENLQPQIAASALQVHIGPLPAVRIPETLLFQLFANLIGNAVRYAGQGGGPVEVTGERREARVRFAVRDHGPGIPAAERQRVFDVFYRGSTGKQVAGTGIGLATVQKIARSYGGRVHIEETPGGGATFVVELLDPPAPPPPPSAVPDRS